jgi:hypothetical protein
MKNIKNTLTLSLFTDEETFTKHRPTKIPQNLLNDLYNEIAEEIISNGWSRDDVEDIVNDISIISFNDSGYEIAKELESLDDCSYVFEVSFIQFLDDLRWRKSSILQDLVQMWVNAHKPQPKFQVGQKLHIEKALNRIMRSGTVYITGIKEKQACYLVDVDKDRQGGIILEYELVESNCIII